MSHIEQAIRDAIKGDWRESMEIDKVEIQMLPEKGNPDMRVAPVVVLHHADQRWMLSLAEVFIDPAFWQALGKARGWELEDRAWRCGEDRYRHYWHRFIDHLAEGKDAESFFRDL